MSTEMITVSLFAALVVGLLMGAPLAFVMGGIGLIGGYWIIGDGIFYLVTATAWDAWTSYILLAVPLFILMGNFLQRSGIAEDLYQVLYEWAGPARGGLAMGTVIICAIFAAMAGISAVGTVTMGLVALPSMLKRNYKSTLAVGCISAGGTLGVLIPPSILMIIYGTMAEVSVGKLFMGGLIPGILLTLIFVIYIGVRSFFQPDLAPAIPKEGRPAFKEKCVHLKSLVLPILLILLVLGVIYKGICTPTEAAAVGAFGAFICLIIKGRFTWKIFLESLRSTLNLSCMIMWIVFGAKVFSHVYAASGAADMIKGIVLEAQLGPWSIIIMAQIIMIVLGMFLDPMGILVLTLPVFLPILTALDFDLVWYGIVLTVNIEMGYITPPFGFNLFYMKSLAEPHGIEMREIYLSIVPFVFLGFLGLVLIIIFPQLALYLPSLMDVR